MKTLTKSCLISILLVLFLYQSWKTVIKYQAGKTSLQVREPLTWLWCLINGQTIRWQWRTMGAFCSPPSHSVKTRCSTMYNTVTEACSPGSSPEKFQLRMRGPGFWTKPDPEDSLWSSWVWGQWKVSITTTFPAIQWAVPGQEKPAPFLSSSLTASWWFSLRGARQTLGWPGWSTRDVSRQPGPLSLVEEFRDLTLIGRELHSVAPPALLCHKEPARIKQKPLGLCVPKTLVGGFGCDELVLYGIRELA